MERVEKGRDFKLFTQKVQDRSHLPGPFQLLGGHQCRASLTFVFVKFAEVLYFNCSWSRLLSPSFLTSAWVNETRAASDTFEIHLKDY